MNNRYFLDTNILVYAYTNADPIKHNRSIKLLNMLEDDEVYISTQVLSEFYAALSKNKVPGNTIRKLVIDISTKLNVAYISMQTIKLCLDIKDAYGFSYWDSLIIATATEKNCRIIYTEDLNHGCVIHGNITIINPLVDPLYYEAFSDKGPNGELHEQPVQYWIK